MLAFTVGSPGKGVLAAFNPQPSSVAFSLPAAPEGCCAWQKVRCMGPSEQRCQVAWETLEKKGCAGALTAEGEVHAKQAIGGRCEAAWEGLGEGREVRRGAKGLLGTRGGS